MDVITSGLSILLHGVISLPDTTSYDNVFSSINSKYILKKVYDLESNNTSKK